MTVNCNLQIVLNPATGDLVVAIDTHAIAISFGFTKTLKINKPALSSVWQENHPVANCSQLQTVNHETTSSTGNFSFLILLLYVYRPGFFSFTESKEDYSITLEEKAFQGKSGIRAVTRTLIGGVIFIYSCLVYEYSHNPPPPQINVLVTALSGIT